MYKLIYIMYCIYIVDGGKPVTAFQTLFPTLPQPLTTFPFWLIDSYSLKHDFEVHHTYFDSNIYFTLYCISVSDKFVAVAYTC